MQYMQEVARANHLNLEQRLITVIQKILCFPAVYSNHTEQKLATEPKGHHLDLLVYDRIYEAVSKLITSTETIHILAACSMSVCSV